MRNLATAEEDRRLDLVTFAQEALDVLLLELVVMLIDLGPELDLLDLDHLLMLLGLARSFLFLVLILPEVHDPADRRHRSRGDLNEVESLLTCNDERLRRRHDPELLTGFVDHPDLTNPDALVGTNAVITSWRAIECDNVLLGYRLFRRISSSASDKNASTGRAPRSPPDRLRTATVPSEDSRSPATSMYGTFCSWASRILNPIFSCRSSKSTRSPAAASLSRTPAA